MVRDHFRDDGLDPCGGDLPDSSLYRYADRRAGVSRKIRESHAPAIILALTPHIAAWGKLQIDNSLAAAGTNAAASVSISLPRPEFSTKGSK